MDLRVRLEIWKIPKAQSNETKAIVHASKITHSNWSGKISCAWIHNSCFAWVKGVWTIKSDLALFVGAFVTFIWHGGWECYVGHAMDFEEKQRPQKGGKMNKWKLGHCMCICFNFGWTYHPRFFLCNVENQTNNMTQMNSQDSRIVDPRMLGSLKEKWVIYN